MGSPSNVQREIDTDVIRKTVDAIQARQTRASGEHALPCKDHESRIIKLEGGYSEHERKLNDGEKQFIRLENGLANVAEKVGTLNTILTWVGGAVGIGLLGTAGTALVWVIAHMGKAP